MRLLTYIIAIIASFNAHAATEMIDGKATATLPIGARIVNVATMEPADALAYCDAHGMECPAIRQAHPALADPVTAYEGADWVYVDETGYGEEYQWIGE